MMGMHGEAWVNHAIQEADLLIALGMRFDDRVTGNLKTYAPQRKKIHIDIDPSEINKNVTVDVALVGGPARRPRALAPASSRPGTADVARAHRRAEGRLRGPRHPDAARRRPSVCGARDQRLLAATKGEAIVVTDVGQHQMWEAQYYHHEAPRSLITSGGLGTMGFALPAAIGAKLARPDAEVWAVVGDGGFQMTMPRARDDRAGGSRRQDRHHQQRLPGMVRQWQEFFYERRYAATPMPSPDFSKLAEAFGLEAPTVKTRGEVDSGD